MAMCVVCAAPGCNDEKLGRCEVETIKIGTALERGAEPKPNAAWLRISSVAFAGTDVYAQAALDLTAVLDSLGVVIYSRSDLIHIRKGTCWPPYNVEFRIQSTDSSSAVIRSTLLTVPIDGLTPAEQRPERYGTFFITCGGYDEDWWTLWYVRLP